MDHFYFSLYTYGSSINLRIDGYEYDCRIIKVRTEKKKRKEKESGTQTNKKDKMFI